MCQVLVIGIGAQTKYAVDIIESSASLNLLGIVPLEGQTVPPSLSNLPLIEGGLTRLMDGSLEKTFFTLASSNPKEKELHFRKLQNIGFEPITLIHPKAVISSRAKIGNGCIVNAGAVVQPFANIGDGVMIHANCVVEHDAQVSDFANLSPGCILTGWTAVGTRSLIFAGAILIPKVQVGKDAVVAAGAVVTRNVADHTLVGGVPANPLKSLENR